MNIIHRSFKLARRLKQNTGDNQLLEHNPLLSLTRVLCKIIIIYLLKQNITNILKRYAKVSVPGDIYYMDIIIVIAHVRVASHGSGC